MAKKSSIPRAPRQPKRFLACANKGEADCNSYEYCAWRKNQKKCVKKAVRKSKTSKKSKRRSTTTKRRRSSSSKKVKTGPSGGKYVMMKSKRTGKMYKKYV